MTDLVKCPKCKKYPDVARGENEDGVFFRISCTCGKDTGEVPISVNQAGRAWQEITGVFENPDLIQPDHSAKKKRSKGI